MKELKSIRKNFLQSGNIKGYAIFIVGELFLVVAGIFFALQLDNWNENRKDKNEAISYLGRIKADLASDTLQLNTYIEIATKKEKRVKKYFAKVSKTYHSNDELHVEISKIRKRYQKFSPTNDTYEELISSGKVKLIDIESRAALRKLQQRFEYLNRADEAMITEVMALEVESQKYFDYSFYKRFR